MRNEGDDGQRHFVLLRDRNSVIGKQVAGTLPVDVERVAGIVNGVLHDRASQGIAVEVPGRAHVLTGQGLLEISAAVRLGWNRDGGGAVDGGFTKLLETKKEKA